MRSPSSPPTPLACQHQRPELILCEAGPAPPPSGITCLTPACGPNAPTTTRKRQRNIDKVSVLFRVNLANYASRTATAQRVLYDIISFQQHLKEVKLSQMHFFALIPHG